MKRQRRGQVRDYKAKDGKMNDMDFKVKQH